MNIAVSKVNVAPNTVVSTSVGCTYKNLSNSDFKYVSITFLPYNNVNDIPPSLEEKNEAEKTVRCTGPVKPGETGQCINEGLWFSRDIVRAMITKIHIIYTNGTEETIDDETLKECLDKDEIVFEKQIKADKAFNTGYVIILFASIIIIGIFAAVASL